MDGFKSSLQSGPGLDEGPEPTESAALVLLERTAEELRRHAEEQLGLLRRAWNEGRCPGATCPHARRMRAALVDAVETIAATRSSFSSRQLEALRRRLMEVLATC